MSQPPTQIEIEQAPAKKLLADERARKLAEIAAAVDAAFPGKRARAAAKVLVQHILDGKIPYVRFNG